MDNPVAVVTGASSGIGQATAIALARDGVRVLVHGYQNGEGLDQTMRDVNALGADCTSVQGDLAQPHTHEQLVQRAWQWAASFGKQVTIWVNVAGADVLTGQSAHASFDEKLEELWRIDVQATIRLSRLAGERMKAVGGCIINVGWDQAEWGMEGDSGELFATTKAAVMAFTQSLAKSLAPSVRVNCVAPGWIKTKWGRAASDPWQQRATAECMLQRWGEPGDVAQAICFLASERATFVNGQILRVNGGFAGPLKRQP